VREQQIILWVCMFWTLLFNLSSYITVLFVIWMAIAAHELIIVDVCNIVVQCPVYTEASFKWKLGCAPVSGFGREIMSLQWFVRGL
jgi:hypothetical protein